jgi:hypothetical protein
MKLSRLALCIALLLAVTGCAALASMGGLEVCVSTPGHAAASASALPSAVATVVPSVSSAGSL